MIPQNLLYRVRNSRMLVASLAAALLAGLVVMVTPSASHAAVYPVNYDNTCYDFRPENLSSGRPSGSAGITWICTKVATRRQPDGNGIRFIGATTTLSGWLSNDSQNTDVPEARGLKDVLNIVYKADGDSVYSTPDACGNVTKMSCNITPSQELFDLQWPTERGRVRVTATIDIRGGTDSTYTYYAFFAL